MKKPEDGVYLLTIPGRLPGLNEYIAALDVSKHKGAILKRDTQAFIGWHIKKCLRSVHFDRPVVMLYTWVEPDRHRDKDNIAFAKKFIQDALVQMHVLVNDGWQQIEGFMDEFDVDKSHARIEVRIWEYNSGTPPDTEYLQTYTGYYAVAPGRGTHVWDGDGIVPKGGANDG